MRLQTARAVETTAKKLAKEVIDAGYVSAVLDGDASLGELFERRIPARIRNRVYDFLAVYEETGVRP